MVCAKAEAAHAAGLTAIICIGETGEERKAARRSTSSSGRSMALLPDGAIADNTVIAYEPVWAIGTGLTPTEADIAEAHAFIRDELDSALAAKGASCAFSTAAR